MCNRYVSPAARDIERFWELKRAGNPIGVLGGPMGVYPRAQGPFIRAAADGFLELVTGQWGLVPAWAKTARLSFSSNNARCEEVAAKPAFREAWRRGQRCIIPAAAFDEPCWETGRNVWWTFRRADGEPWGLAGLWNTWVDPVSGEVLESYTMLTQNADACPVMSRMHKPDPALAPDKQDKRSVIPIERADVDCWLHAQVAEAAKLLRLPSPDIYLPERAGRDPAQASMPGW